MIYSLSSLRTYCAAAMCAVTFAVATPAQAASEFRIVNMQTIITEAKAAKDVGKRIDSAEKKLKDYVSSHDEELRGKFQKLQENRSLLSPEDFKAKNNNLNSQVSSFQVEARQKGLSIRKAQNEALVQIQKAVIDIVKTLSKEQGFDIALPGAQVLFHADNLDITKEVITRLNKKLPSIKIDL